MTAADDRQPIARLAETIYHSYYERGAKFSLKSPTDDLAEAISQGICAEDPVWQQAQKAIAAVDKRYRRQPDPQQPTLELDGFIWPGVLVLGEADRHPAATARIQHVLADFAVKAKNNADQNAAFARYGHAISAVTPYLQQGMTLQQAVTARGGDNQ